MRHSQIGLTSKAMRIARRLAGEILDEEFGIEVGRDPDPACQTLMSAFELGLRYGLVADRQEDPESMQSLIPIENASQHEVAKLTRLIEQHTRTFPQLDIVRAMTAYASWGLLQIERHYRSAEKYDIDSVLTLLQSTTEVCRFCGALIPATADSACPRCGILRD